MTFNPDDFGFDVSYYQGVVDFQKMKAYGAKFVIIRVGQGNFIDIQFTAYKNNARGILPRAFYWFYDPRYNPLDQAKLCINAIAGEDFSRLWIDMEFWWAGAYSAPADWLLFRNAIKFAGYKTGIYTSKTWWDEKVTAAQAAALASDPVWVAQYNYKLDRIPEGWTNAMIWQDSVPSIGIQAGASKIEIDHNLWNTDYNFITEWGITTTPPIGEHMKYKAIALTDGTRLRPNHNVNETYIATYPRNTEFYGDVLFTATAPTVPNQSVGDKWLEVKEIKTAAGVVVKAGWVAVTHLGNQICMLEETAPVGDTHVDMLLRADGTITGTWTNV